MFFEESTEREEIVCFTKKNKQKGHPAPTLTPKVRLNPIKGD